LACILIAAKMLDSRKAYVLYGLTANGFAVLQSKDPMPSHV
jgi:hypothetical protein